MIRNPRARARRSARFESLESRCVMAGNVTVGLIDGSLFIEGDDAANGIAIVSTEPGQFRITGTPAFFGDVTELNQQTGELVFAVTGDIIIRMGAGNDGVELNNVDVPRNLTIETGDGLDRVSIGSSISAANYIRPSVVWPPSGQNVPGGVLYDPARVAARLQYPMAHVILTPTYMPLDRAVGDVTVARNLSIVTDDASDYVYLGRVRVNGDIDLRTGEGDDILVARNVSARKFYAGMDRGGDLANIANLTTRGQLTLETGYGNDFVSFAASHAHGAATFLIGHGDNQLHVAASVFSGVLYVESGIERDRIFIKTSMLLGNASFVTGSGADRVDIDYCFGRFVSMITGAGNDLVSVRGSALDNIYAHLGDGDDQLWLTVSRILYPLIASGGAGNDLINDYGNAAIFSALPEFELIGRNYPSWQTG